MEARKLIENFLITTDANIAKPTTNQPKTKE